MNTGVGDGARQVQLSSTFDVVALAASTGGLQALSAVLAPLPRDFPAAIVVVQHLSARYPSALADLLGRRTELPVMWAARGLRVRPGTVYVAPPGYHTLTTPDGRLALSQAAPVQFARPAADALFVSAAQAFAERAIAVILTGMGSDGAAGARSVKMRGGRVLAQDADTARVSAMPRAAVATGCVDFTLPLALIAPALIAMVMVPGAATLLRVPPPIFHNPLFPAA